MNGSSSTQSAEANTSAAHSTDATIVGCVHYDRQCYIVAPCCGKTFGCRVSNVYQIEFMCTALTQDLLYIRFLFAVLYRCVMMSRLFSNMGRWIGSKFNPLSVNNVILPNRHPTIVRTAVYNLVNTIVKYVDYGWNSRNNLFTVTNVEYVVLAGGRIFATVAHAACV